MITTFDVRTEIDLEGGLLHIQDQTWHVAGKQI